MGWHLSLIRAHGPQATVATVEANGFTRGASATTPDDAVADDLVALVDRDDGVVELVGRLLVDDALPAALSAAGGLATAATWQSTSDTYLVEQWRDGALARRLVRSQGEVLEDEGAALPAEADVDWDDDPEDALFALVEVLVGEPVGSEEWMARPAVVLDLAPPPPARRRRFGRRR